MSKYEFDWGGVRKLTRNVSKLTLSDVQVRAPDGALECPGRVLGCPDAETQRQACMTPRQHHTLRFQRMEEKIEGVKGKDTTKTRSNATGTRSSCIPWRRGRNYYGSCTVRAGPACRTRQERTCTPPDRRCANCMPQRWSGARPCWAIRGRVGVLLRIREVYWRAWDRLYSRAGLFLAPCQSRRLRQVAPLIAVRYFFWLARLLSMVSIAEPHLFSVSRSGRPLLVFERIHWSAKSKRRLEHVRAQHFSREECCDKVPAKSLDPVRHLRASW